MGSGVRILPHPTFLTNASQIYKVPPCFPICRANKLTADALNVLLIELKKKIKQQKQVLARCKCVLNIVLSLIQQQSLCFALLCCGLHFALHLALHFAMQSKMEGKMHRKELEH